jgi:hypothetical protein
MDGLLFLYRSVKIFHKGCARMGSGVAMVAFWTLVSEMRGFWGRFACIRKHAEGTRAIGCGMRVLKSVTLIKLHCYLTNDCKSSEVQIMDENEWWMGV